MTKREVRSVLNAVIVAKMETDHLITEIEEIREEMRTVKAIRYDIDRVQTTPTNPLEEAIIRLEERGEKLNRRLAVENEKLDKAERLIMLCSKPERRSILIQRYIARHGIQRIADDMNYDNSSVYRIIREAVAEIAAKTEGVME